MNLFGASTALIRVSSEVILETSTLAVASVDGFVPAVTELVKAPVSAYSGYIQEDRKITESEADKIASALFSKDAATAIRSGSKSTGRLLAALLEDWDEPKTAAKSKA